MSADFVPVKMDKSFCEVYHAEWKLTNLLSYKNKKLITPPFSPLSNLDVKFCFEMWLSEYSSSSGYQNLLLKFILVKLDDSTVPASMKLEIEMGVLHSDRTLVKEYHKLPIITVKDMDCYYFDEIHQNYKYKNGYTGLGSKLDQDGTLLLECRMIFFGHLENSPVNCVLPSVLCPLKTSDDIKSSKRSDEFSDIIIRVASKLFLAHKAVLSHHSSVFIEMISQKRDNENVLVLDDKMCDAFDSFLDYLYSGNFEDTSWPMVRDVYILSAKYKVDVLKEKCSTAILSHLSVDKVCDILKIAYDYENMHLKDPATQFAVEHIREIISSKEWREFITTHPLIGCEVTTCALNM